MIFRLHDWVIYQKNSTRVCFPSYPGMIVCATVIAAEWCRCTSENPVAFPRILIKTSLERDLSPGAGVYLLLAHVSPSHWILCKTFLSTHSSPPNPKGLRGRTMTKGHATDGKRSPVTAPLLAGGLLTAADPFGLWLADEGLLLYVHSQSVLKIVSSGNTYKSLYIFPICLFPNKNNVCLFPICSVNS